MPIEATGEDHLGSRAGERLRAARERLGIDRGELSLRTKINERHLAAVEDSDFSALPARIYAVGFARSYAGAVGLDGGVIATQVRRELNEAETPANPRPAYDLDLEDPAKVPSRRLAWIAAALGIVLIAAGAVFWRSYFVPAVDLPPVREQMVANAVASPELTPAAMLSPTAESAAGLATSVDPAPGEPAGAAVAAAAKAPPAPRATTAAARSLPAPAPSASASVAPAAPAEPQAAPSSASAT
jgi:cytoskeletal protein RodZ